MTTFNRAANRTFGVEIEGANIDVREVRHAVRAHSELNAWDVTTDGTAGVTFEVVSPVLNQDAEGFAQVRKMCDVLNDAGAEVNVKCGLHVHIGVTEATAEQLAAIANRYNYFSTQADALVAQSRRANNNHFCRDHGSKIEARESANHTAYSQSGRYYKMNLRSFLSHGTVENRHHQGTLNASKIINWVKFVAYQVECGMEEGAATGQEFDVNSLRGKRREMVTHLQHGDLTWEELGQLVNSTRNTIQSAVSRMKKAGVPIRMVNGRYHLDSTGPATPNRQAFMPAELDVYYGRRRRALRTVDTSATRQQFAV